MKSIIKTMALSLLFGTKALALGALPEAQGPLSCIANDGSYTIEVAQEVSSYLNQSGEVELTVKQQGDTQFIVYGTVHSMTTRAGAAYNYNFPLDNVDLHLSEFTKTIVSPPGCQQEHSRITCDYQFVSTLSGTLTVNGDKHHVTCD